jgi:hypothetical protein
VSPTLFTLEILVLSGGIRPRARAWALAAGAALALALFFVLGLTVIRGSLGTGHHPDRTAAVDLAAALLLLGLAGRTLVRAHTAAERHQSRVGARLATAPTPWYLAAGALGMLTNFSTLVLVLPALHEIAASDVGRPGQVAATGLLFVVTLVPVWLPVAAVSALGRRADALLARTGALVSAHSRGIGAGVEVAFAIFLAVKGVTALI